MSLLTNSGSRSTILSIFNILVFTFLLQSALAIANKNLALQGFLSHKMDNLELTQFLVNIIAGFIMIPLAQKCFSHKIILAALAITAINIFLINTTTNYYLAVFYLSLITGSGFVYLAISLTQIITYNEHKHFVLIAAFLALLLGYLFADDLALILHKRLENKQMSYIILGILIFLLISTFLSKAPSIPSPLFKSSFPVLMKNIELQIISAFTVTYISSSIYWDYETFIIAHKSTALTSISTQKTMALSLLVSIIPLSIIITKFNKYTLILIFTIALFSGCLLLPKFTTTPLGINIVLSFIGISLFAIFITNILILCQKFMGEELSTSLTAYFWMSTIGTYIGIISTDKFMKELNELGFLLSLHCTLGMFLAYYILQFIKLKLYRTFS